MKNNTEKDFDKIWEDKVNKIILGKESDEDIKIKEK